MATNTNNMHAHCIGLTKHMQGLDLICWPFIYNLWFKTWLSSHVKTLHNWAARGLLFLEYIFILIVPFPSFPSLSWSLCPLSTRPGSSCPLTSPSVLSFQSPWRFCQLQIWADPISRHWELFRWHVQATVLPWLYLIGFVPKDIKCLSPVVLTRTLDSDLDYLMFKKMRFMSFLLRALRSLGEWCYLNVKFNVLARN